MDDSDGNDIWETTVSLAKGSTVMYKFRNQPSFGTWDGFEPADGLAAGGCGMGDYNDRFVIVPGEDIVLETVCYGSCVSCDASPEPVTVYFELEDADVPCGDTNPYVTGTFDGWSGWGLELTHDAIERYSGSIDLMPGEYEYKFVCGGWADQETVPAECNDGNGDEYSNRLVVVEEGDGPIHLPPTQWGGCPELMVDQVMVTLWLDADGVPCDGNPYVAGSFNGWSATEMYMNYDPNRL